ncbi:tropomyosin A-like [Macrobrachium rosenbergii]|uniref:tropomyosin A-like n=1 Tax=Macrobrachium rosenbergii TaxID=79674 RepID=UPI0034D41A2D
MLEPIHDIEGDVLDYWNRSSSQKLEKSSEEKAQWIQILETALATKEYAHAEELIDLSQEAQKKITQAEDTIEIFAKENRLLKQANENNKGLVVKQRQDIDNLNGLIAEKDLESRNNGQCNEELQKKVVSLQSKCISLQERLNESEVEKVKIEEEMEDIGRKLGDQEFHLNDKTQMETRTKEIE